MEVCSAYYRLYKRLCGFQHVKPNEAEGIETEMKKLVKISSFMLFLFEISAADAVVAFFDN